MIRLFRYAVSLSAATSRRWLVATLVAWCTVATASQVRASGVDEIVVRYHDAAVATDAVALPELFEQRLRGNLAVPLRVVGRTRDGAFAIRLDAALDIDSARAALNALRLDPAVLYAGVAPGAPAPATSGLPTDRIIVKYRDPILVSLARAGYPLDGTRVARVMAAAGTPVAWLRGAHDGGNVMGMLQRLPIGEVESIAQRIAEDPDVDYAVPDYVRSTQLVPTDPCYASAGAASCGSGYQWDLFHPAGGINMPAAWDITTGSPNIRVAVLDTGALLNHPDLAGRFVGGHDTIADCAVGNDNQPATCAWSSQTPAMTSRDGDGADPGDWVTSLESSGVGDSTPPYNWFQGCLAENSSWHGTHVAGTIGAIPNNGIGIAGINWVSPIVPVRVSASVAATTATSTTRWCGPPAARWRACRSMPILRACST